MRRGPTMNGKSTVFSGRRLGLCCCTEFPRLVRYCESMFTGVCTCLYAVVSSRIILEGTELRQACANNEMGETPLRLYSEPEMV
jgi:hypothetical protein